MPLEIAHMNSMSPKTETKGLNQHLFLMKINTLPIFRCLLSHNTIKKVQLKTLG